jgi:hypothetical protein
MGLTHTVSERYKRYKGESFSSFSKEEYPCPQTYDRYPQLYSGGRWLVFKTTPSPELDFYMQANRYQGTPLL